MPRGGARDGAGRKGKDGGPPKAIARPIRQFAPPPPRPRAERIRRKDGRLDPLDVMQENMEFYHEEAGKILAVIMQMPVGDGADRLEAMMKFADSARMRASSQACANDLAKYYHHSLAAQPYAPPPDDPGAGEGTGRLIDHSQLDGVLGKFTEARQPAPVKANGSGNGFNGGGHNGTNGHG